MECGIREFVRGSSTFDRDPGGVPPTPTTPLVQVSRLVTRRLFLLYSCVVLLLLSQITTEPTPTTSTHTLNTTMVRFLKSMEDYNAVLETSKSKLVVIDFTASW